MQRGIEVTPESMALDLIRQVNYTGNYLQEPHTAANFRKEHFIPRLANRDPFEAWQNSGQKSALDAARKRVHDLTARAKPVGVDPLLQKELDAYCDTVSERTIEQFYAHEQEGLQTWEAL
jgi:trimethylamine--corrinoid protein Co-methyltransferase